jgi:signal recognition particle subunit SRP54
MTPRERAVPHVIDGNRRLRIARGSGSTVQDVNQLIEARKMMEKVMKQMGKGGKMPTLPGLGDMPTTGGGPPPRRSATKKHKKSRRRSGRR